MLMSVADVHRVAEMTVDEIFKQYFASIRFVYHVPSTDVLRGRAAVMLAHARELIGYYEG